MKKIFIYYFLIICLCNIAVAKCNCTHNNSNHSHHHSNYSHHHSNYSSSSGNSHPVYLIKTENSTKEEKFPNCKKHYMITETTINYYSDGSKRIYLNSKIYDSKNAVIASDCSSVEHIVYKNNHYFAICKNRGGCSLINEKGENITKRSYSMINKIADNRLLVKCDKKYGIID